MDSGCQQHSALNEAGGEQKRTERESLHHKPSSRIQHTFSWYKLTLVYFFESWVSADFCLIDSESWENKTDFPHLQSPPPPSWMCQTTDADVWDCCLWSSELKRPLLWLGATWVWLWERQKAVSTWAVHNAHWLQEALGRYTLFLSLECLSFHCQSSYEQSMTDRQYQQPEGLTKQPVFCKLTG